MLGRMICVLGFFVSACASPQASGPSAAAPGGGASTGSAAAGSAAAPSGEALSVSGGAPGGSASPAAAAASAAAAAAADQGFTFQWRAPCRVPVEELVEKKGKTARLRYVVVVQSRPDGRLSVRLEEMSFVEANGLDVTSPEWQARLAPALAMVATLPVLVVTPEGEHVATEGIDAMVERVLSSKAFTGGSMPKESSNAAAKLLRSDAMKELLAEKMTEYWAAWVEAWIGGTLAPGEVFEGDIEVPLGGQQVPTKMRFEHHGPVERGSKLVRLSLAMRQTGDVAAAGMASIVRMLIQESGQGPLKGVKIESFNRVMRAETETDPASLRPRRARHEVETQMIVAGKKLSQREVHDSRFDWAKAKGCI